MTWIETAIGIALLAPLLTLAEAVNPEMPRGRLFRTRGTDALFLTLQLLLVPLVGTLLAAVAPYLSAHGPLHHALRAMPLPLIAIAAFLVADVVAYWVHRSEHKFGLLWRPHSIHHSATTVDWLAGFRFHPVDVVVEQVPPILLLAAVGVPLSAIAPYLFVAALVTLFAHCNVVVPGRILGRLVVVAPYHRSHHELGGDGHNFALVLPAVDVVFGTASFTVGDRHFGTDPAVPRSGFVSQLAWGFGFAGGAGTAAQRETASSPIENDSALAT